jgi:lipopolysaccharide/colanic/teichoic acid biosynthesis glycosyltransferase
LSDHFTSTIPANLGLEATVLDGTVDSRHVKHALPALREGHKPTEGVHPHANRKSLGNQPHTRHFIILPAGNRSRFYLFTKRALDLIGAVVALVLLSPIMLAALLVLVVTTKGRPIFCQQRIGFCGRRFTMFKFRSMVTGAADQQHLVDNDQDGPIFKNFADPRITRFGRFLRTTSIDETPQLINVLLGNMSLVGPRPPLAKEVEKYEPWQRQRLSIKPGLTCLWQVRGRSEIGFDDWMRMDIWYLKHQNLWTDLKLLLLTPYSVLSRRGAY